MERRSIFQKVFGGFMQVVRNFTRFQFMAGFSPIFSSFGSNAYASDVVRAAVHAIASNASKLRPRHIRRVNGQVVQVGGSIEYLLSVRPNKITNAYDFYYKVITQLLLRSNAFILIQTEGMKIVGFIPIIASTIEVLEYEDELYMRFYFSSGKILTVPYEEVVHLRRFFNDNDMFGETNEIPLLPTLELINTTNQGISNAIKSSAYLRGLLKFSNAMLKPADIKKERDEFVKDYMDVSNNGGVAALDGKADYTELKTQPMMIDSKQMDLIEKKVYKYFGVNEKIIMAAYNEDEWNAFYESVLEPIGLQLSLELTSKIFTDNERAFGNEIIYEAKRLQHGSLKSKLELKEMVDRGAMTPNEWREALNLGPIEGGDKPIRRLDTAEVKPNTNQPNGGGDPNAGDNSESTQNDNGDTGSDGTGE